MPSLSITYCNLQNSYMMFCLINSNLFSLGRICVTHFVLGRFFRSCDTNGSHLSINMGYTCGKPIRSTKEKLGHFVLWAHFLLLRRCECERHPWMTEWNELSNTNAAFFILSFIRMCSFAIEFEGTIIDFRFLGTPEFPCIAVKVVQFEQRKRCRLDWWRRFWTSSITFRHTWVKKKKKKRTILSPSLVPPSTPSTSSTTTILSPKTRFLKAPPFWFWFNLWIYEA